MEMSMMVLVLAGVAVLFIVAIGIYNSLVTKKNRTDEAWADIDVQLKRRYDLIPNLVETVKGYATHEKSTLDSVITARNAAMSAHDSNASIEEQAKNENVLSSTLKSIFALSESYPDLKANQNFMRLQDELSDTENKIQAARRFYNSNVRDYNTAVETVPTNIVAKLSGFAKRDFFEITESQERENVKVAF